MYMRNSDTAMTEAAPDKVQIKYAQQFRDLKQILLAKHFAGKAHFVLPLRQPMLIFYEKFLM